MITMCECDAAINTQNCVSLFHLGRDLQKGFQLFLIHVYVKEGQ